jgi:hypothetical protein
VVDEKIVLKYQLKKINTMKKIKSILASTVVASALVMHITISEAQTTTSVRPIIGDKILPFKVNFSKKDLDDLRRRILETRWPDKETANDQSQGVPLATMQKLAHYWATDYDWRKELDESDESLGEENNCYSLGGDHHNDLEEDNS